MAILELIRAEKRDFWEALCLLGTEPIRLAGYWVIHNKGVERMTRVGAVPFKFLTYQLSAVEYWPTVALTGNGELGFDSGEGAR